MSAGARSRLSTIAERMADPPSGGAFLTERYAEDALIASVSTAVISAAWGFVVEVVEARETAGGEMVTRNREPRSCGDLSPELSPRADGGWSRAWRDTVLWGCRHATGSFDARWADVETCAGGLARPVPAKSLPVGIPGMGEREQRGL